MSECHPLGERT